VYEGSTSTISSPNYPKSQYPGDAFCVYTITVPTGRACVEFVYFWTDTLMDIVSVFDGHTISDIPIMQYV